MARLTPQKFGANQGITMPAQSKSQRRFFGMALNAPDKMDNPPKNMSKNQMKDFASTSEKGLPDKVKPASDKKKKFSFRGPKVS